MKKPVLLTINSHCYLLTLNTNHGFHIFDSHKYLNLIFDCLSIVSKKYKLNVLGYVFLPDGIKLITTGVPEIRLTNLVEALKNLSRKEIIRFMEEDGRKDLLQKLVLNNNARKYKVWAANFEAQHLKTYSELEQAIKDIHFLPVIKGVTISLDSYNYSSYNYYKTGQEGGLKVIDYTQMYLKPTEIPS